jgi:hypothetical protein
MTGSPLNNKITNPDIIAAKDPDITAEERRKDNQANSFINRFAATLILLFVSFINNNMNTRQQKTQQRERGFQRSEGRESREKELREPREASGGSRVCKCFVLMRRKEKGPNVGSILSLSLSLSPTNNDCSSLCSSLQISLSSLSLCAICFM